MEIDVLSLLDKEINLIIDKEISIEIEKYKEDIKNAYKEIYDLMEKIKN